MDIIKVFGANLKKYRVTMGYHKKRLQINAERTARTLAFIFVIPKEHNI